ncbi:MAG: hypothetical protein GY943_35810, partial [Chloroflexi bacterium]|nr:hypothetical protein [Chloroflexota bacterium]
MKKYTLLLLAVWLSVVACAPTETAQVELNESSGATAVPATADLPTATPLPPTATPEPEPDLTAMADVWQATFNSGDVDALLALYDVDAAWSQTNMADVTGGEALSQQLAFDLGLQGEITLTNCVADTVSVSCEGTWEHEWQTAVSLPPFTFDSITWTIADELIVQEQRTLSAATVAANDALWVPFKPWGKARHPGDMRSLFSRDDGLLIPTAENAALLVTLLTEWQTAEHIASTDAILGVWSLFTPDIDLVVQFLEDGTGRVATKRSAFANAFNPEDEASGYLFAYWFEGSVLFIKQTTPGDLKQGVGCNVDKEEVGQYIVDRADQDGIRFWMVDDRCSGRIYGLTNN